MGLIQKSKGIQLFLFLLLGLVIGNLWGETVMVIFGAASIRAFSIRRAVIWI